MSLIMCDRCASIIDTDCDDAGIYAGSEPFEFLCGNCCDQLLNLVPGDGGKVEDTDIVEAFRNG